MVILLGENEAWENIKKILSDPNLMLKIRNCSPTAASVQKVKKRVEENGEWTVENVAKVSFGSRFICKWIIGVIRFGEIKASIES